MSDGVQGWRTPAEASDYRVTPDYTDTLEYVERVARAYPSGVRVEKFGTSGEGRDLKIVIVSRDAVFDPAAIHSSGRVILLAQNCIHAGEPDGKDACLALLRDLASTEDGEKLLEHVAFVFIPVYNVDGHERRSAFNRINQNGPELVGWRANGANLNLNRDYMKADAPETRAFLRLLQRWRPDFFVDNHVTDGADFQYDVTFALDTTPDVFPPTAGWLRHTVTPELVRRVNVTGHLAFPSTVFLKDDTDPSQGLVFNENPPRFSTGRMILENRPGLLVEMHMLKDYRTRVTGNYAILRGLLELMHRYSTTLRALNEDADRDAAELGTGSPHQELFPLVVGGTGEMRPGLFRGKEFVREPSDVSGATAVRYGPRPLDMTLPMDSDARVVSSVRLPAGYIIPPPWTHVIEVLEAQGVTLQRTTSAWTGPVERYHCSGMQRPGQPFEGRYPILRGGNVEHEFGRFGACVLSAENSTFAAGSAVVPLNQRLSKVAVHWLEPEAPDSALRWGFFDPIFEQKETGEAYVLEKLSREWFAQNPALYAEFEERLRSDPKFVASPADRLGFFYEHSPWRSAQRIGEYPVGRLLSLAGLPVR
jgi:hypothetical protein